MRKKKKDSTPSQGLISNINVAPCGVMQPLNLQDSPGEDGPWLTKVPFRLCQTEDVTLNMDCIQTEG